MSEKPGKTRMIQGADIELVTTDIPRGGYKHALFDFDGTLSLVRQGWQEVMIGTMVEALVEAPRAGDPAEITETVTEFVTRLTGLQTIYQMIRLTEEIEKRGGTPKPAQHYKDVYSGRLLERIKWRREGLRSGEIDRETLLVPGTRALLEGLRARGVRLYCASGTDHEYLIEEAALLGLDGYFDGGLYGALDDYKKFSKDMIIRKIIADHSLHGSEFLGVGDGFVEIEDTKAVGGTAIGVATSEPECDGVDDWKRTRLIEAGADIIIPHYREHEKILQFLFEK